MNRSAFTLTTAASIFIFIAIIFQIARVAFGDALFLTVLNQLALVIFTGFLIRMALNGAKRSIFIAVLLSHTVLLMPVLWHAFNGKDITVLALGHVDNLKFLFPLSVALLIPGHYWTPSKRSKKIMKLIWNIIFIGVFFSVMQQMFPALVDLTGNPDEKKELYRYGLLRVPSFFSEINAFASISFLLIPLGFLHRKRISISIIIAVVGILMAFSRQFILGIAASTAMAAFLLSTSKWSSTLRLIVGIFVLVFSYLSISALEISLIKAGNDDGLLTISDRYIRTAVAATSIEVIKDKPIFGVGTGYFGGNIGKKFGITEDLYGYGLLNLVPYFDLTDIYYTDTLWPQLLAEYGLIGFSAILVLFILWYRQISNVNSKNNRFLAIFCYFQFIFSAFTSPLFNFIYFSVSLLILTLMISSARVAD